MGDPIEPRINFIQPGRAHYRLPVIIMSALVLAAILTGCLSGYRSYCSQLAVKDAENNRLWQELEQTGLLSRGLAEFQDMERDTEAIRTAIDSVSRNKRPQAALLEEIYQMSPPGMGLKEIQTSHDLITITGFCPDYYTLGGLLLAADSYPFFGPVRNVTSSLSRQGIGPIEFVLEVEYKGAEK
ncbi:MAG: hypothetical protein GX133_08040 [Syntrophomonadaceae bacterium]|nr:hypothetical protein [Syntrophomonadaceae bacterium]